MRKRRIISWGGDGCGFLLFSCFLSGCLLLLNGALVKAACVYLTANEAFPEDSWTINVFGFSVPLLMLVAQWRLVDLLSDVLFEFQREFIGRRRSVENEQTQVLAPAVKTPAG